MLPPRIDLQGSKGARVGRAALSGPWLGTAVVRVTRLTASQLSPGAPSRVFPCRAELVVVSRL